ncbi:MAG: carboxylating nicotinate-nucleotide diphosphorylase [Crocinitomicaceae bacterium]|nr:carboxylating nicotinate-nucleotide diphosphorylase [Crocinitomicaceae bacterium]
MLEFQNNQLSDSTKKTILEIIDFSIREDIGEGDHTSLATIPADAKGKAKLLVKDTGILAGIELAHLIFHRIDPTLKITVFIQDGTQVNPGEIAFEVEGSSRSILSSERLVLNFMQRMSGIATKTFQLSSIIKEYKTKLLDTRKTTPGIRLMEKWAVKIGGGNNHRFALYDMVMIKDNHVDYAGGIKQAIDRTNRYLKEKNKDLKIEIEVRNLDELNQVIAVGKVNRIMLDNFSPFEISDALKLIDRSKFETEASGKITEENILDYAKTGVDFISSGSITHSYKSLDLSLKAEF